MSCPCRKTRAKCNSKTYTRSNRYNTPTLTSLCLQTLHTELQCRLPNYRRSAVDHSPLLCSWQGKPNIFSYFYRLSNIFAKKPRQEQIDAEVPFHNASIQKPRTDCLKTNVKLVQNRFAQVFNCSKPNDRNNKFHAESTKPTIKDKNGTFNTYYSHV